MTRVYSVIPTNIDSVTSYWQTSMTSWLTGLRVPACNKQNFWNSTNRSIEVNGVGAATVALLVPSGATSDDETLDPDAGAFVIVESGESSLSSGQLNDSFSFVYTLTESTIVTPAGSTLGPTAFNIITTTTAMLQSFHATMFRTDGETDFRILKR